ncbi:MAG: hypothetical protein N3A38_04205 [Planctomycetota bacterium]|nr:hypothetical protein [Planctomycetota bacterium]
MCFSSFFRRSGRHHISAGFLRSFIPCVASILAASVPPTRAQAGGDATDAGGGAASAHAAPKKKDPPLKVSAWCPFRDRGSTSGTPKSEPGSVELRKGAGAWMSYCRSGHWMPLVVEMRNTTEDSVLSGTIRIRLDPDPDTGSGPYYRTHYIQSYEIPPRSPPMRYRFSLWIPSGSMGRQCFVTVEPRGGFASSVEAPFNIRDLNGLDEKLVVVVSEKPGAFGWLGNTMVRTRAGGGAAAPSGDDGGESGGAKVPAPEGKKEGVPRRIVCWCGVEEFPSRWYELTMADLIVIDGPPRDTLSADQIEALAGYVMAGGRAILNCGKDPSRLRGSPLAELFGVEVEGLTSVPSLRPLGPPVRPDGSVPVMSLATASDGAVALRQEETGSPLVVRRPMGLGELTTLAFDLDDPPLAGWAGRASVAISACTGATPRSIWFENGDGNGAAPCAVRAPGDAGGDEDPGGGLVRLRTGLNESFAADSPVSIPAREAVAGVLLIYLLLLVPVNYLVSESFRRRELAWVAVPVLSAIFAVAAYKAGFAGMTARFSLSGVSIVELAPGADRGIGRTFLGLYSPSYRTYSIRFPGQDAAPNHLLAAVEERLIASAEGRDLYLQQGGREMEIAEFAVQSRSIRGIEAIHIARMRGPIKVRAGADRTGRPSVAEVSNGSGFALLAPTLIWNGRAVRLADEIPPGADKKFSLRPSDFGGIESVFLKGNVPLPDASRFNQKRSEILRAFLASRMAAWGGRAFLAWISGDAPKIAIDGYDDVPVGGWLSLIAIPVEGNDIALPATAGGWEIPPGLWTIGIAGGQFREIPGPAGAAGGAAEGFYSGAERVEVTLKGPANLDFFAACAKGAISVEMGLNRGNPALRAAELMKAGADAATVAGTVELEIRRAADGSWEKIGKRPLREKLPADEASREGAGEDGTQPRIHPMPPMVFDIPGEISPYIEGGRFLRLRLTVSDLTVGGRKPAGGEHAYPVVLIRIVPRIAIPPSKRAGTEAGPAVRNNG